MATTKTMADTLTITDNRTGKQYELPITDGIVELQLANNLSTSHVHAGQTLVIPDP